jgi:hypothetical protein
MRPKKNPNRPLSEFLRGTWKWWCVLLGAGLAVEVGLNGLPSFVDQTLPWLGRGPVGAPPWWVVMVALLSAIAILAGSVALAGMLRGRKRSRSGGDSDAMTPIEKREDGAGSAGIPGVYIAPSADQSLGARHEARGGVRASLVAAPLEPRSAHRRQPAASRRLVGEGERIKKELVELLDGDDGVVQSVRSLVLEGEFWKHRVWDFVEGRYKLTFVLDATKEYVRIMFSGTDWPYERVEWRRQARVAYVDVAGILQMLVSLEARAPLSLS